MEISQENLNDFELYLDTHKSGIEDSLQAHKPQAPSVADDKYGEALNYALASDSVRIRPFLALLSAELLDGKASDVMPAAVAVELIHASSRVFDCLVRANNSDSHDNLNALHEKFDKDIAPIIGVELLNAAYPLVFVNHAGTPERAMQAHSEIVECVGAGGFLPESHREFDDSRNLDISDTSKDSTLIRLAMRLGAILSGADYIELANISRFAELSGEVYVVSQNEGVSGITVEALADEAKEVLIENFSSNEARTCLIQFIESLYSQNHSSN